MSIATVVTRGYGTGGGLDGSLPLVTVRGYSIGAAAAPAPSAPQEEAREYPGGSGAPGVTERRRKQREQDDQDFLDIITLALPEIMKHLK